MKKLFVYYSLSGNGDYVAGLYRDYGFDVIKAEPCHGLPKNRFGQMMIGGMLALFGHPSRLKNDRISFEEYEEVVVGTPVWNGRVCCPMKTIIRQLNDQPFTLICYSASGKAARMPEQVREGQVKKVVALREPLENQEECRQVIRSLCEN